MDYLQPISERTKAWIVTSFADEIGLNTPEDFVDTKSIMGDKSDNIPRVYGVGDKAAIPLVNEYGTLENIYNTIEGLTPKEEKELKKFFKESLGISRSPIAYMLKEGTIALSDGEKLSYKCISGDLTDEQIAAQESIKEKLGELRFPIEITSENGLKKLQNGEVIDVDLSAKESAFMRKELSKIVTYISAIQSASLEDTKLNINQELLKTRLIDLDFKILLQK